MKMELEIVEYQDLETHLNRIKDFTGTRVRTSNTTSSSRRWDSDICISIGSEIGGGLIRFWGITYLNSDVL